MKKGPASLDTGPFYELFKVQAAALARDMRLRSFGSR